MSMIDHFKSGVTRSIRSWKGILIIWLMTLLLVSTLALPLRAGINNVLGNSMITELFSYGINIDVLADFSSNLGTIFSFFRSGFFFILLIGIIMNAFLSGGIFTLLRTGAKPSSSLFFAGGASNFWSFLIITLFNLIIIILLIILIVAIPLSIISTDRSQEEGTVYQTGRLLALITILIIPVFVLVADYARAWQVSEVKKAGFSSVGTGFKLTFTNFFFSYFFMVLILAIQIILGWLVIKVLSGAHPVTGAGVFLLFIISQSLFILKIFVKTWRYGNISSLFESGTHVKRKDITESHYEI